MASWAYVKQGYLSPGSASCQSTATGPCSRSVSGECTPIGSRGRRTPMSSRAKPYVPYSIGAGGPTDPSCREGAQQHAPQTTFEKPCVKSYGQPFLPGDPGEAMAQQIQEMEMKIVSLPEGVVRATMQSALEQLRDEKGHTRPQRRVATQQPQPELIYIGRDEWLREAAGLGSQPQALDLMGPPTAYPTTAPMPTPTALPESNTPIERQYYLHTGRTLNWKQVAEESNIQKDALATSGSHRTPPPDGNCMPPNEGAADPSWRCRTPSPDGNCMLRNEELHVPPLSAQIYNEDLQDAIYLRDGVQAAATRLLAAMPLTVATPRVRVPSRTPSPLGHNFHPSLPQSWMETPPSTDLHDEKLDAVIPEESDTLMPVKHTFVHYTLDVQSSPRNFQTSSNGRMEKCASAPGVLMMMPFSSCAETPVSFSEAQSRDEVVNDRHGLGKCSPCAYFSDKADGCRRGNDCNFCHQCPSGELRKRKREKRATLRAKIAEEKRASTQKLPVLH